MERSDSVMAGPWLIGARLTALAPPSASLLNVVLTQHDCWTSQAGAPRMVIIVSLLVFLDRRLCAPLKEGTENRTWSKLWASSETRGAIDKGRTPIR